MTDPTHSVRELLNAVATGQIPVDEALVELARARTEALGFARLDHDRALRRGLGEVVFGAGKTPQQLVAIVQSLAARRANVLCTRVDPPAAEAVQATLSEIEYDPLARVLRLWRDRALRGRGPIAVLCAGTSDLPVAREAALVAQTLGNEVVEYADVGVAGLHRLLEVVPELSRASVLIAAAGMEAALPSVLAGLVDQPVIAVPTSVGYGASFGGLAALLSCLNACSSGVLTVNIDNGFGAAIAATLINRR